MADSGGLTWRELRDGYWLAKRIHEVQEQGSDRGEPRTTPQIDSEATPEVEPVPNPPPTAPASPEELTDDLDLTRDLIDIDLDRWDVEALPRLDPQPDPRRRWEQARLRTMAGFSRALRPFRTTTQARDASVIDEVRTAVAAAEDPLWLPVFQAARERAWEAVLVIDDHATMEVWEDELRAFHTQIGRQGFRNVHLFYLHANDPGYVRVSTTRGQPKGSAEIVVPTSKRVILVLTDGAAPGWRSGATMRVVSRWGRYHAVAVISVLPQTRWHMTGVRTEPVKLRADVSGAPNASLQLERLSISPRPPLRAAKAVPVPVLEFDPRWVQAWSKLVAGEPGKWSRLPVCFAAPGWPVAATEPSDWSADPLQQVAKFRETVSREAFQLATYLAAFPLDVRLMRSVQARMMPGSTLRHMSEVLVSPLVKVRSKRQIAAGQISVAFDFRKGVREELLANGRSTDILLVADAVEEAAGRHTLSDVLRDPEQAPIDDLEPETVPWVRAEAAVLTALSGKFLLRGRRLTDQLKAYDEPIVITYTGGTRTPPEWSWPNRSRGSTVTSTAEERTGASSPLGPARRRPILFGNVPPKNVHFTGRRELLVQLHEMLQSEDNTTTAVLPQALHGMGGVGKTLLAVEYLYRFADNYDLIWWVPAERPARIGQSLVDLAVRLGLPDSGTEANTAVPLLLDALRRGEPYEKWLLIFDNAENPEIVRPYLPTGGPGKVLITSRDQRWGEISSLLEVDLFKRIESKLLLQRRQRGLSDHDADRLAEALGDLPLALEQAAAWFAETGMPVDEYLELLQTHTAELLESSQPLDYPTPVIAAWNISLDRLALTSPSALQLLQMCAYFAAEPIPRSVLTSARAHDVSPVLDEALRDPIKFGRALREIGKYSLARIDHSTNSLYMHRLVQAALRNRMSVEERGKMRHAAHIVLTANDPNDPESPASFDRYGELYAHVQATRLVECGDRWARELVINESKYLYRFGEHVAARRLGQAAYDQWSEQLGAEDPQTLAMAKWLGFLLFVVGSYKDASVLNANTLRIYHAMRNQGREDREGELEALRNTQADAHVKGDFQDGLEIAQRVFEGSLEAFGDDDPATLNAAHNVAVSLRLTGAFNEARTQDEQTLDRKQQVLGTEHPLTVATRLGLLVDMRELGEYREALGLHEDALAQCHRLFGDLNPITLLARRLTGVAMRKAGHHEEAHRLADLVSSQLVRRYTLDHPEAMAAMSNLSIDQRQTGKLMDARGLGTEIHERYGVTLGSDHPHTLSAAVNLAITHRLLGDSVRARHLNEDAFALFTRRLGPGHPNTLACAINLASDLAATGEHERALELGLETAEHLRQTFGETHPTTLACSANVCLDLRTAGRDEVADQQHSEVVRGMRSSLGGDHPATLALQQGRRADVDIDPMPL